jgi:hypothetical protein
VWWRLCQPQTVAAVYDRQRPAVSVDRRLSEARSESFSPAFPMQDENDQPNHECENAAGNCDKQQPTQHSESVKELAIILSINDARMHGSFVHLAAV